VSRGALWIDCPEVDNPAGSVVLFSAEDDLADTIKPRLEAADAELLKIVAVEGIAVTNSQSGETETRSFTLADLPRLIAVLENLPGVRLVVIDPISAYCGETDSHKNADVRELLGPLAKLASERKLAVVCITHLSKGAGGKAVYRATGSLAFAAAARAVWMVAKDPDDKKRRLLLPVKMNLTEEANGLAYAIQHGRVVWEPTAIEMTADEFLATEAKRQTESTDRGEERQKSRLWLEALLRDGPLLSKDVKRQGEECGITWSAVRHAKDAAKVRAVRFQYDGPWYWALPGDDRKPAAQDANAASNSPVTKETAPLDRLNEFPEENAQESDDELPGGAPPECQPLRTDDPAAGTF
jgi:RecA-family ATPase